MIAFLLLFHLLARRLHIFCHRAHRLREIPAARGARGITLRNAPPHARGRTADREKCPCLSAALNAEGQGTVGGSYRELRPALAPPPR